MVKSIAARSIRQIPPSPSEKSQRVKRVFFLIKRRNCQKANDTFYIEPETYPALSRFTRKPIQLYGSSLAVIHAGNSHRVISLGYKLSPY